MADFLLSKVKRGGNATKSMYNAFTYAGWAAANSVAVPPVARASVSGALTANTLVDLLNETGSAGQVDQFCIFTNDATARTIRVVVTVDGTDIYDFTSASISSSGSGCILAGARNDTNSFQLPPIRHSNAIRIQYASNLTETGKFTTGLAYQKVT